MTRFRLQAFTFAVMLYMMLAFGWWSVLLFTKNRDAFQAKVELIKIGMVAEGVVKTEADFYNSPRYQQLRRQYQRQERMVWGESLALVLSLLGGMYIIYRGYQRQMYATRQQRNFLLSITHELKSPLAGIRLVVETLLKRELKPQQIQALSANALKETDRLTSLVEDLLLSAKLETAYQPNYESLDLDELLRELLDRMAHKHPEAKFIFASPDYLPTVQADRTGLVSIATNLLENAVKYSPGPAQVSLSVHNVGDKMVEIRVADQGAGIPNGEKQRIFGKFYRVGNEDTRQTKGTGLGLFIVREIIRAHGGKIRVSDNTPRGSIFTVSLPIIPA